MHVTPVASRLGLEFRPDLRHLVSDRGIGGPGTGG